MKVVFNYPLAIVGDQVNVIVPCGTEVLGVRLVETPFGIKEKELLVLTDPDETVMELLRIYKIPTLQSFEPDGLKYLFADDEGSYWVSEKRHQRSSGK